LRVTVVASMRNEGPFIVEWVSWYRMLGFTDIVVVTNDCADHSPQLLDALQAAGWVHHLRCDVPPGKKITHRKLMAASDHKALRRAHWLLVCDVDEFLVIHKGAGKIGDLIGHQEGDAPFLAMAFNWRVFGFGGVKRFDDRPVHQQFVFAVPLKRSVSHQVKMLHRQPRWFKSLGEHGPRGWDLARYRRTPEDEGMFLVNARGDKVPGWSPEGRYLRQLPAELCTHEVAQMNHYMLRSEESFSLKFGTRAPVSLNLRYTDTYRKRANFAPEVESSAFRYAEAFSALQARAMALPGVAQLHAQCCADHLRLIAEKHGQRVEDDPRWQGFIAQARG
jgi:hypothetical protein